MNIIEDIWDALLHVVEKRSPPPRTSMDLLTALQDSWCEFPPGYLQTLVESTPQRFASLLRAHGAQHDINKANKLIAEVGWSKMYLKLENSHHNNIVKSYLYVNQVVGDKFAKADGGVTAAVQARFSDESLTADATELLELSNKLHSSASSDTSATI
ncbi:hypothetical protein AVEN_169675-1 [Araneus ventricosus]|uniref:Uncharacterized protein n=1 Tax=Araneus ventricosus TaxID=182803 RepID=A0A4Y2D247_ARAVE|nr:hypothetical protein AVEN_169675-1 [Araneus ventricosus]